MPPYIWFCQSTLCFRPTQTKHCARIGFVCALCRPVAVYHGPQKPLATLAGVQKFRIFLSCEKKHHVCPRKSPTSRRIHFMCGNMEHFPTLIASVWGKRIVSETPLPSCCFLQFFTGIVSGLSFVFAWWPVHLFCPYVCFDLCAQNIVRILFPRLPA